MKLRKNMWVASPENYTLLYVVDFKSWDNGQHQVKGYGFGIPNNWNEDDGKFSWYTFDNYYEEKEEEVHRRLLEEVKKRGYVNGKQYLYVGEIYNKSSYPFLHLYKLKYYLPFNKLTDGHGSVIFQNGKWSPIEQLSPLKGFYFPNGFDSWYETHHEMVTLINHALNSENPFLLAQQCDGGTGRMYELAKEWTDEFEKKYENYCWDGEFFDFIEVFVEEKLLPTPYLCPGDKIRFCFKGDLVKATVSKIHDDGERMDVVITYLECESEILQFGKLLQYLVIKDYSINKI